MKTQENQLVHYYNTEITMFHISTNKCNIKMKKRPFMKEQYRLLKYSGIKLIIIKVQDFHKEYFKKLLEDK